MTISNQYLFFRLYSYQRCARRRVRPLLLDPFHLYYPTSLVPASWDRGCPSGCHGLECGWGRGKKIRVLLPVGWLLSLFPSMHLLRYKKLHSRFTIKYSLILKFITLIVNNIVLTLYIYHYSYIFRLSYSIYHGGYGRTGRRGNLQPS